MAEAAYGTEESGGCAYGALGCDVAGVVASDNPHGIVGESGVGDDAGHVAASLELGAVVAVLEYVLALDGGVAVGLRDDASPVGDVVVLVG